MSKKYFFISDVHLGLQSKELEHKKEQKLVSFLQFASRNCDELIILGDLFDYWFEYRRVIQKGFFKTLSALEELSERGVKVHYIIGNHDFMHRDFFAEDIGATLYYNPFTIGLNGKKFFLGHGDGLISNDLGYKILKKVLRNKFLQFLFSLIHPDLGIKLASSTSKKSRDYTKTKDYGESDSLFEVAKKKIDHGADYVMFGHSHRRRFEKYNQGYYVNLGTWLTQPCYGKFENDKFEIIDWE
ncbi:MAG: UDP-2,3-diacylglucosamine diphosphatase [Melioribacteraceae bacterium]|nr:UDP-2,3-diacylglucosamine diphosphatase [Melioribacteraceae bacterium]